MVADRKQEPRGTAASELTPWVPASHDARAARRTHLVSVISGEGDAAADDALHMRGEGVFVVRYLASSCRVLPHIVETKVLNGIRQPALSIASPRAPQRPVQRVSSCRLAGACIGIVLTSAMTWTIEGLAGAAGVSVTAAEARVARPRVKQLCHAICMLLIRINGESRYVRAQRRSGATSSLGWCDLRSS